MVLIMDIKPGDIIDLRHRLWRIDFVDSGRMLFHATNIDGGRPRKQKFYYPLETLKEAHIPGPSPVSYTHLTLPTNREV